jgi:hypothetical protein
VGSKQFLKWIPYISWKMKLVWNNLLKYSDWNTRPASTGSLFNTLIQD